MSKMIAGKIFSTPEEVGVTEPTAEELERARKDFEEFQAEVRCRGSRKPQNKDFAQILG
ncbi:hypothetical protein ACYJ3J_04695 [Mycobacterium avium subsp. paratuberculosis]|uniref:hypothetical protein n=1 Tax=Mycobacterium avium TaxID=1764 RepID=UPI001CC73F31|nr:hypothetical protein [Mycobacterium avium]UKO59402.1 hypothetical protein KYH25_21000 [Mycobacterium avium subsp. paratuberculosis]UKO63714.1 hypothetical protein KYF43_21005 [Mycobacterium avium subsp. paratuberculosis]UKO68013.1 hypothetical protein KYG56_21010 [Mycobacterium avium subsp. paratuberculosis]UKO72306.1 hypothetical protein KYG70_20990 [Mycobacterium avium subsp. paratuberculosis]UYB86404.1 hypothetical protein OBK31_22390 [Mycobacterium avium subsp. paratuberculosis K-10]